MSSKKRKESRGQVERIDIAEIPTTDDSRPGRRDKAMARMVASAVELTSFLAQLDVGMHEAVHEMVGLRPLDEQVGERVGRVLGE